jgi:hypothetical protein
MIIFHKKTFMKSTIFIIALISVLFFIISSQAPAQDTDFIDHGDGTVTDSLSGLMWKKCSEGQIYSSNNCVGSATTHTWPQALALAEGSTFAGYNDWRLPNIKELLSLARDDRIDPAINSQVFPNTPNWYFWSSSVSSYDYGYSWYVNFATGFPGHYDVFSNYNARIVRSGQPFSVFNYVPPSQVITFLSENLPDGTFQLGSTIKRWRFKNGGVAFSNLKAVRVSADASLGISFSEINLGNVEANTEFVVELPINVSHGATITPKSVWKLVDGTGKDVTISNSPSNTFWLALRTNHPPSFSPLQLESLGGKSGQMLTLPLLAQDEDNDSLTYTVADGGGSISGSTWKGSFTTGISEIRALTVQVSDGLESATKKFEVVVYATDGLNNFFADVPVDNNPNGIYAATHFLAGKGIVIGYDLAGSTTQRLFKPEDVISQAEALKMLLLAARERGLVTLDEVSTTLPNLVVNDSATGTYINYSWAAIYAATAQRLGMINTLTGWNPAASVTRAELARWLNCLLDLNVPYGLLESSGLSTNYRFTDEAAFSNDSDYRIARQIAFFGYLGTLNATFGPATQMQRGDFAVVAAKVLRAPSIDGLVFGGTTTGTRFDLELPVISHGQTLTITGVRNLLTHEILISSGKVLEEWIDPPKNYVRIGVSLPDGTSLGAPRYVSELTGSPLSLNTNTLALHGGTLLNLTVLIKSRAPDGSDLERSGVGAMYKIPIAIDFPDRDSDGVRDDLDLWPDDWRYSVDANGNGYPDLVDDYLSYLHLSATDLVVLNGVTQSYTYGEALMKGYPITNEVKTLIDIINYLQMLAGQNPPGVKSSLEDINKDGRVGIEEVINALQELSKR